MKYIKETYTEEVEHSDLDLINVDEILGLNEDGHDYRMITTGGIDMWWNGEAQQINIDTLIDTLQKMKKNGANYVEIMHHGDHHGYNIYGVELRKATYGEIRDFKEALKEFEVNSKKNKITALEKEIKDLKINK